MKASNTQVMIQAYRLLVTRMKEEGMNYPLHLGVTEAGEGEDGRIKSALGIGSLLADGLGDTIRVSLTEDPEAEIPVAQNVVKLFVRAHGENSQKEEAAPSWPLYEHKRRPAALLASRAQVAVGGDQPIRVRTLLKGLAGAKVLGQPDPNAPPYEVVLVAEEPGEKVSWPIGAGCTYVRRPSVQTPLSQASSDFDELSFTVNESWLNSDYQEKLATVLDGRIGWLRIQSEEDIETALSVFSGLKSKAKLGIEIEGTRLTRLVRKTAMRLNEDGISAPLHFHLKVPTDLSAEDAQLLAAKELGGLLCDGLGDSVEVSSVLGSAFNHRLAYNVLQASRRRMFKTEFISCPSCGRTLFDLQETTDRIRQKTGHLKDVKIAIMGCIVNGPGEMADADFGYVGAGPDRIHLYVVK
jgi:(E)-4-hydroxy-3-methylbut-2-enyl-diphosphate synthase